MKLIILFLLNILITSSVLADYTIEEQVKSVKKLLPIKITDRITFTRIENFNNNITAYLVIDAIVKNRIKFVDGMKKMMLKSECTDPFKRTLMYNQDVVYEYKYYDKKYTYLGSNYIHEKKCINNNYPWDKFYTHEVNKFDKEFNINTNIGINNGKKHKCEVQGTKITVILKDNFLYILDDLNYRKFQHTTIRDTYENVNDNNYKIRVDGTNLYFLNGIRQTVVKCKEK